jgi:hypothetical protein
MAIIRQDLHTDVGEVVERARELVDWRIFVRNHPWLTIGTATAVGFLLVPKRLEVIRPDPATMARLAEQNRFVVNSNGQAVRRPGLVGSLLNAAVAAGVRSLVTMAGNYALASGVPHLASRAEMASHSSDENERSWTQDTR